MALAHGLWPFPVLQGLLQQVSACSPETGVGRFWPRCLVSILVSLSSSLTVPSPSCPFQITGVILLAVGVWGKLTLGTYISLIAENSTNAPYMLIVNFKSSKWGLWRTPRSGWLVEAPGPTSPEPWAGPTAERTMIIKVNLPGATEEDGFRCKHELLLHPSVTMRNTVLVLPSRIYNPTRDKPCYACCRHASCLPHAGTRREAPLSYLKGH